MWLFFDLKVDKNELLICGAGGGQLRCSCFAIKKSKIRVFQKARWEFFLWSRIKVSTPNKVSDGIALLEIS